MKRLTFHPKTRSRRERALAQRRTDRDYWVGQLEALNGEDVSEADVKRVTRKYERAVEDVERLEHKLGVTGAV
jgi:hypothetical protein